MSLVCCWEARKKNSRGFTGTVTKAYDRSSEELKSSLEAARRPGSYFSAVWVKIKFIPQDSLSWALSKQLKKYIGVKNGRTELADRFDALVLRSRGPPWPANRL